MKRLGRVWAGASVLLGATLLVTGIVAWGATSPAGDAGGDVADPVTAPVERTTFTAQTRLHGQLSYGTPQPLPPSSGMITRLPSVGQVIERGQEVYEVEGNPVVLFAGERPFWRELSTEASGGEDVRQLQTNLRELGFDPGRDDGRFDWRTDKAVRAWQRSLGLPQDGVFSPSRVVVADSPRIRIAQVTARAGDGANSPGSYTATGLSGSAALTPAQARRLEVGEAASIELPDGSTTAASVAAIDPGGQPTGSDGERTPPTVILDVPDQDAVAAAGAGDVRVTIAHDGGEDPTLMVPVHALIATADGGYAVERLRDDGTERIAVTIGRVGDARVEIRSSGEEIDGADGPPLTPGDRVVLAR